MKRSAEMETAARIQNFPDVKLFIREELLRAGFARKESNSILLAAEEIFVNIAQYAYAPSEGNVLIQADTASDPPSVRLRFTDRGTPFNPMTMEDPDVDLFFDTRQVGGFGIYMAKQIMDTVSYEFNDGCNILTMEKRLS